MTSFLVKKSIHDFVYRKIDDFLIEIATLYLNPPIILIPRLVFGVAGFFLEEGRTLFLNCSTLLF